MMKTVVFLISLLSAAPFLRAQDAVAEDSGRATLLTPEALGETVALETLKLGVQC